jgi:hypothetical protein
MARSHESRVAPSGALAGVPPPAPLTVGSWNVNSVRARLLRLLGWLARRRPDVACLQETNAWWDYREGAFHRGWGRPGVCPSDHAPVVLTLAARLRRAASAGRGSAATAGGR